jgi:hypothetical protein
MDWLDPGEYDEEDDPDKDDSQPWEIEDPDADE